MIHEHCSFLREKICKCLVSLFSLFSVFFPDFSSLGHEHCLCSSGYSSHLGMKLFFSEALWTKTQNPKVARHEHVLQQSSLCVARALFWPCGPFLVQRAPPDVDARWECDDQATVTRRTSRNTICKTNRGHDATGCAGPAMNFFHSRHMHNSITPHSCRDLATNLAHSLHHTMWLEDATVLLSKIWSSRVPTISEDHCFVP